MNNPKHIRNLFLLFTLLLSISTRAQQQVIGTYDQARQLIELHYFDNHFSQKKTKVSISISYLNGVLVDNPYFSTGACQSMQLNRKGEQLYFFLTDRLTDVKASSWTACFRYDFKTKNITKLFSISKQQLVIWRYIEGRQSIIYYHKNTGTFIEQPFENKQPDTLMHLPIEERETWFEADSNHILFYGRQRSKIVRWSYQYFTKKSVVNPVAEADHFCGTNGTNILYIPPGARSIHITGQPTEKTVPFTLPWGCWIDHNYFCVTDENYFYIYNTSLTRIAEYQAEQTNLIGKACNGVLAGKTENNQRKLIWLGPGFGSEQKIAAIFPHTVYLISELL